MNQRTAPLRGAPTRDVARDAANAVPGTLRRDSILVLQTPVDYLCLGFGEAARTLRFVFDDGAGARRAFGDAAHLATALDLQDIVPAPVIGSAEPLDKGGDRYSNRLAALASLAKSGGYDPDEPRDDHGRWTSEGGVPDEGGTAHGLVNEISAFIEATARYLDTKARTAVDAADTVVEHAGRIGTLIDHAIGPRNLFPNDRAVTNWAQTAGMQVAGTALLSSGNPMGAEFEAISAAESIEEGSFAIINWARYPANLPKPTGSFRIIEGQEYNAARAAADNANRAIRAADPAAYVGKEIHEIHPVKFGGSPTDPANKIILTKQDHSMATIWWYRLMSKLMRY